MRKINELQQGRRAKKEGFLQIIARDVYIRRFDREEDTQQDVVNEENSEDVSGKRKRREKQESSVGK